MININLKEGCRNNFSDARAKLLALGKYYEGLGYIDNSQEMSPGVCRCEYVQKKIEERNRTIQLFNKARGRK